MLATVELLLILWLQTTGDQLKGGRETVKDTNLFSRLHLTFSLQYCSPLGKNNTSLFFPGHLLCLCVHSSKTALITSLSSVSCISVFITFILLIAWITSRLQCPVLHKSVHSINKFVNMKCTTYIIERLSKSSISFLLHKQPNSLKWMKNFSRQKSGCFFDTYIEINLAIGDSFQMPWYIVLCSFANNEFLLFNYCSSTFARTEIGFGFP